MIKHICDRCKAEIDPVNRAVYVTLRQGSKTAQSTELELCSSCGKAVVEYCRKGQEVTNG